jgi:hypothetical protein
LFSLQEEGNQIGKVIEPKTQQQDQGVDTKVQPKEFQDIFVEPTTLPPVRQMDHQIILKPDSKPINLRRGASFGPTYRRKEEQH